MSALATTELKLVCDYKFMNGIISIQFIVLTALRVQHGHWAY